MKSEIIIIEVGSTVTKSILYKNKNMEELPSEFIEFKKKYNLNGHLLDEDKLKLFDYVNKVKNISKDVFVYGTSIFRSLSETEKEKFILEFKNKTGLDFKIVSSLDEQNYTISGVVSNINYDGNIAIMVGGGGSTEIAIVNDKEVVEQCHLNFGGVDVINLYPDLTDDIATTDMREVIDYIKSKVKDINSKADVLVLAGGATKYFREKANYKFTKNTEFYYNELEMVMMNKNDIYMDDVNYFYKTSLNKMKEFMPDSPNWWNPTRAINSFAEAIAEIVDAKYVAASNINMIYGIIEEITSQQDEIEN